MSNKGFDQVFICYEYDYGLVSKSCERAIRTRTRTWPNCAIDKMKSNC